MNFQLIFCDSSHLGCFSWVTEKCRFALLREYLLVTAGLLFKKSFFFFFFSPKMVLNGQGALLLLSAAKRSIFYTFYTCKFFLCQNKLVHFIPENITVLT